MKTTTVQFPKLILETLKKIARSQGRSVGSQVRIFVEQGIKSAAQEVAP